MRERGVTKEISQRPPPIVLPTNMSRKCMGCGWTRRICGADVGSVVVTLLTKTRQCRGSLQFGSTDKSIAGRQPPSLGNEVDGVLRPLLSLAFFPQPVNGCVIIESLHSFNFPPSSSSPTRINNRKRRESLDFVVDPFSSVLHAPEFEAPVHANPEDGF